MKAYPPTHSHVLQGHLLILLSSLKGRGCHLLLQCWLQGGGSVLIVQLTQAGPMVSQGNSVGCWGLVSSASSQDLRGTCCLPWERLSSHTFLQNYSHQSLTFFFIPYEVWYTKHSGKLQFDMWMTLFDAKKGKYKWRQSHFRSFFVCVWHTIGNSNSLRVWSRGFKIKCLDGPQT